MLRIHCGGDFLFTESGYMGTLIVETDLGCFPSEDWTDNPEIVLGWWVDALKSVFIGHEGKRQIEPRTHSARTASFQGIRDSRNSSVRLPSATGNRRKMK